MSRLTLATAVLAMLSMVAATPPSAHADKCTAAKLKAIGKKESGLLTCQAKVAATGDISGLSACETKVMGKFQPAFDKAGACAGDRTTCETSADNCEAVVAANFTDTFPSKCEAGKRKAAAKLTKGEFGCYAKAEAKGVALDPGCITKVQGKFSDAMTKAGGCPDGGSPQDLIEANCVASLLSIDSGGMLESLCSQPLIAPLTCCQDMGSYGVCGYTDTATTCNTLLVLGAVTFSAGPAGSRCDAATGQCSLSSPVPGPCCDGVTSLGAGVGSCASGSVFTTFGSGLCTNTVGGIGGTFHASGICKPSSSLAETCQ